ncbi:MAG: DUF3422 domain-containing protein [Alphaproteobacteria bacterium]|nr:DUF3422 domain-containing protein [Alphaproteobacteria bacterium]
MFGDPMTLPPFHPQRFELSNEVHARPPQPLETPSRLSCIVVIAGQAEREKAIEQIRELSLRFKAQPPDLDTIYTSADLGPFRLTFERHAEFMRFTFTVSGAAALPFDEPAVGAVPDDWIAALPGEVIVAAHVAIVRSNQTSLDIGAVSRDHFAGQMLIGSELLNAAATAFTDFRIHGDGFSRFLVHDRSMSRWQSGRIVQRLLEIDTYRVMALLALPVARELAPRLSQQERELSQITSAMVNATEADEAVLLDRLSRLQAAIEDRHSSTHYRFSAASAYYDIVQTRIADLRERRIEGLQTFEEFTERRLAPAMNTCRAVAARQVALAERVARATQLLSTRVDITRERHSQSVLESMNERAALQLRLQETVEGLSVAAVTYYVVGLIFYAAKALQALGVGLDPNIVAGFSIPVVVIMVALGVRSIRNWLLPKRGKDAAAAR